MLLRNVPGFRELYGWVGSQGDTTLTVLLVLAGAVMLYTAFRATSQQKVGVLGWVVLP